MAKAQKKTNQPNHRINDEIRYYNVSNVRIIGEDIESKVISLEEAKKIAASLELDLVEINGKIDTPILRICDYGKFLYEQKKAANKNKQVVKPLKEIQLRVNIAENDLKTKAKKASEFIEDGSKVKVVLSMKGRELTRREDNKKTIYEFITMLDEVAVPESMPKDEGNKTVVILKAKRK